MVVRKLQKTSANTFFVALPKDWVQEHELNPSDELTVQKSGEYLLVYPTNPKHPIIAQIEIKESPHLERDLLSAYLGGYDIIRIVPGAGEVKIKKSQQIRNQVRSLLDGLKNNVDSSDLIEYEFFFPLDQLKPDQDLKKCFDMVIEMVRDYFTALETGNQALAENISIRDAEVNRTYFLLVRMLRTFIDDPTQRPPLTPTECLDFRMVAAFAEELGDKVSELCNLISNGTHDKIMISKTIKSLYEEIFSITNGLIEAFITHKEEDAVKLKSEVKNLRTGLTKINEEISLILHNFLQRFFDILDDIADLCT